jgi:hypothetical protein
MALTSQIHAYEQVDDIRGTYWDVWREYADDDADFLMSVGEPWFSDFKKVCDGTGYGIIEHPAQEPAWNEPITLRLVPAPTVTGQ